MPGYVIHQGATVVCSHAGQAQPVVTNQRVKVSGQPIVVQTSLYTITGCALSGSAPQCVTAQWITASTRVRAGGIPVLLQDSLSMCTPTSTSLKIIVTQMRVKGT